MIGSRLGKWLPLLFAVMTMLNGWLALGSLAQSTAIVAAVLRRLSGKLSAAVTGVNNLA